MGTPKRYAARRDHNEPELLIVAKTMGARITRDGPLDCWIHTAKTGWVPVEIKNGKNKHTADQVDFIQRCLAWRMPVFTWRTRDDVIQDLGGTPWRPSTVTQPSKSSQGCAPKTEQSGISTSEAVMTADAIL